MDDNFQNRMAVLGALANREDADLPPHGGDLFDPAEMEHIRTTVLPVLQRSGMTRLPVIDSAGPGVEFHAGVWIAVRMRDDLTESFRYRYSQLARVRDAVMFCADLAVVDLAVGRMMEIVAQHGIRHGFHDPAGRSDLLQALIVDYHLQTDQSHEGKRFREARQDRYRIVECFSPAEWRSLFSVALEKRFNHIRALWQLRDEATLVGYFGIADAKLKLLDQKVTGVHPSGHLIRTLSGPLGCLHPILPAEMVEAGLEWSFLAPLGIDADVVFEQSFTGVM